MIFHIGEKVQIKVGEFSGRTGHVLKMECDASGETAIVQLGFQKVRLPATSLDSAHNLPAPQSFTERSYDSGIPKP